MLPSCGRILEVTRTGMSVFGDIIISFTVKFKNILHKWISLHSIYILNKLLGLNGYNIFKFMKSQRGDFRTLKICSKIHFSV